MARTKITAYVTPDLADALKRLAAIDDRSLSDIIEDALQRRLSATGREAEHAALMARLDQVAHVLRGIERGQETHFELTAQTARFALSVAPVISSADQPALDARGADRLRTILGIVVARLAAGRSLWREAVGQLKAPGAAKASLPEPAE